MISYQAVINGIEVNAHYSAQAVDRIFVPFLDRISELQKHKGRRLLVMLAAPPGAGKTTLLSFLEKLWQERGGKQRLQVIGMDGFHRRQEYLKSHFVLREGRQISMVEIKGAPVTFDLEGLTESIRKVSEGKQCGWPVYDRLLHNPVENAVTVDADIILLEGNYLLLDENGWRELQRYADYTVSVRAEESLLRSRLISRRIKTGVDEKTATQFVDFCDMPNVRLCLAKTVPADLQMALDEDGDYRVLKS